MAAVDVGVLAAQVRQRAPAGPLDQVEAALALSAELASGADELIGQFVTGAREAGCTWTEIGARMGVSKQAARQRYTPAAARPAGLARKPRLEACLAAAAREAAANGAAETGTQHLLLGLFAEGVAAAVLDRLGARVDAARALAREMFPSGGEPSDRPPPQSADADDAIAGAENLARRAGCGYVGTEHLLAALALDPGSRARRVLERLGVSIPAVKKELECYISPARRRRRARGKAAGAACSFCGKPRTDALRLVAGPGVYICAECIGLCNEILAESPLFAIIGVCWWRAMSRGTRPRVSSPSFQRADAGRPVGRVLAVQHAGPGLGQIQGRHVLDLRTVGAEPPQQRGEAPQRRAVSGNRADLAERSDGLGRCDPVARARQPAMAEEAFGARVNEPLDRAGWLLAQFRGDGLAPCGLNAHRIALADLDVEPPYSRRRHRVEAERAVDAGIVPPAGEVRLVAGAPVVGRGPSERPGPEAVPLPRLAVRDSGQPSGDSHLGAVRGENQREQHELDRPVLGGDTDGPAQRHRDDRPEGRPRPLMPRSPPQRPAGAARLKPGPRGERRLKAVDDRLGCRQIDQLGGGEVRREAADPVQSLAGRLGSVGSAAGFAPLNDPAYLPSSALNSPQRRRDGHRQARGGAEGSPCGLAGRRKSPALDALSRSQHAANERIQRAHGAARKRGRGRKQLRRGAQWQRSVTDAGTADRRRAHRMAELTFSQQAQVCLGTLTNVAIGPQLSASGHAHLRPM